jgi:hypothetical protein
MCYERWMWRHRRADEAGRHLWDLFERETAGEPPRVVSDDEPEFETPEPTAREAEESQVPG